VLILLYRHEGVWKIPFTLRPQHLAAHAGQVSFPGGSEEAGETSEQCALREWTEELGPPQTQFEWLGQLPQLYVFNSNFRVTPCLAFSSRRPAFAASPAEVERVLEVPLAHLCDPGNAGAHWIRHGAVAFRTPHIAFRQDRIWGATAIMLGELLTRLRQIELPN
jgi:8-oxo-dGTP pyrophosphatase MutT (NUDIX family)